LADNAKYDGPPESGPVVRLGAVGDILLSDGYFDAGCGMGSLIKRHGPFFPFEAASRALQGVDVLIGNLESALAATTIRRGLRANEFLAPPLAMEGLSEAGFHVLLVANNHILQHGPGAYRETIGRIEQAGIRPVGQTPGGAPQRLVTMERKGLRLGFLGYSMTEDEHNPEVGEYAHYREGGRIVEDVRRHRGECDCLVLLMHWGDEYVSAPCAGQIELAHSIVDEGVDVIIGSHPHVLQAVEVYRGKTIAYSLGNFVFNMPARFCRETAMLSLDIGPGGRQCHGLRPFWIDGSGRPAQASGRQRAEVEKTMEALASDLEKSMAGLYPYEEMKARGLDIHRQAQKRQFLQNLPRMKKRWALRLLYEFLRRRMAA